MLSPLMRRFVAHRRLMLTAVLSLAAAMTATVVGLGVFNAVMLRPPGVDAPRELLSIYVRTPDEPFDRVSFEDYRYYRDHNQVFSGLAAFPFTISVLRFADGDHRESVTDYQVDVSVIARTSGRADGWIAPITQALTRLDPHLAFGVRTFEDHMYVALLMPMFILAAVSGLGALALVLAIVGLYGTVFYSVSQRRHEIGVRVALGAQPCDLFGMVLRQTARLALGGAAIGVLLSLAAQPVVASLFYGIRPVETAIIATVIATGLAIAIVTAYVAARPWTRMNALEMVRRTT